MGKYKNHAVVITFFLIIGAAAAYAYRGASLQGFDQYRLFSLFFWIIPIIFILTFSAIFLFKPKNISPAGFKKVMVFFAIFLSFIIPIGFFDLFVLLSDVILGASSLAGISEFGNSAARLLIFSGNLTFVLLFITVIRGIIWGRFDFKVKSVDLSFQNLPANFDGLKIVQVSDFHIGCFIGNTKHVQRGINLIKKEEPDIIFFTGDLVTIHADEVVEFIPFLNQLKARLGMYSVLGNHSYSGEDYFHWNKVDSAEANQKKIINHHKTIGFDILLNESRKITVDDESISVIGIENWGYLPFPQAGNIDKALENVDIDSFKILLSHDPSFWEAKVIDDYPVDLTLSGHTHGMQMGIQIADFEWSPASFKYPRWGGLYEEKNKLMYVNRGFGHVIYSARIGMPPEITSFILRKKQSQ